MAKEVSAPKASSANGAALSANGSSAKVMSPLPREGRVIEKTVTKSRGLSSDTAKVIVLGSAVLLFGFVVIRRRVWEIPNGVERATALWVPAAAGLIWVISLSTLAEIGGEGLAVSIAVFLAGGAILAGGELTLHTFDAVTRGLLGPAPGEEPERGTQWLGGGPQ